MKNLLKIVNQSIFIILLFFIVCFLILFLQTKANPQKVPSILGFSYLHVISGSMEPTINTHDFIIIKSIDTNKIEENDIITYYSGNGHITITHRVIEVINQNGQPYFKTKGDNNNVEDETLVSQNQVIGQYLFRLPFMGYLLVFLSNPFGWITIILLIGAVYVLTNIKFGKTSDDKK